MFLKRLSPFNNLFSRSQSQSPLSIFIAKYSTYCASHPVSVWWDIDNCSLSTDFEKASKVSQYITAAVQSVGIRLRGPIQINAYGDLFRLKEHVPGLSSSGINLMHISPDGKGGADKYIQSGITYWAEQNPPPAHILLVSGDKDFAQMLHRLRLDKYNIMLACRETFKNPVHCELKSAATVMWRWDSLLRDESLIGRYYFNQPPSSSYGHYDGPIEDPFSLIERHAFTRGRRDVPKAFSREDFWIDVLKFLKTDLGSLILAESNSRGNLALLLHKYGPAETFRSLLSESAALGMIDCLISEKEWLIETPHDSSPFKLHQRVTSVDSHPMETRPDQGDG